MSEAIDFGVFLSTERSSFADLLSEAKNCERLGYHSIWLSDHLVGMYIDPNADRLECWTALASLAGATSSIRLGQLVLCNPFRHPPLLAKMAATLDLISGGRLELGMGAGWHEPEFRAYGYPFEKPGARIRRLEEAVRIVKLLWTEESPSFDGQYYQVRNAYCSPKPVQKPHPPLMIGGEGDRLLRVVALHADVCNFSAWLGTPEDYSRRLDILQRNCETVGRDHREIRRSWAAYALIDEDPEEVEKQAELFAEKMAPTLRLTPDRVKLPISGTPEECVEQIRRYIDIGISLFILRFVGKNPREEARIFASEVIPSFG